MASPSPHRRAHAVWLFVLLSLAGSADAATEEATEPFNPSPGSEEDAAAKSESEWESDSKDPPVLETTVTGKSEARALAESAHAVTVVSTREAKKQSADMGEVLRRTQGVSIRRAGGLGSPTRFSLNGLYDEQIRFFIDGVPLDVAGYGFDVANVPVNLIDRVEIYRGVVPIRFGADALGGAVNLVSDRRLRRNGASFSLQVGTFRTLRATGLARFYVPETGFVGSLTLFHDRTDNDYLIDVELTDERGRLHPATVRRFHDGYEAFGVGVEVGVLDRTFADRLTLRLHHAAYDKELQHNTVMTVPYGEVRYGEGVTGGTLRYELHDVAGRGLSAELTSSYARRDILFRDDAKWIYDWRGARVRERRVGGEIEARPRDQVEWQDSSVTRAVLSQRLPFDQTLHVSLAPTYVARSGDERIDLAAGRDLLNARRRLLTLVTGLEHELSFLDGLLETLTFVKSYTLLSTAEEELPGGAFRRRDRHEHHDGLGGGVRVVPFSWLYAKASYEWATRLPNAYELFGNGALVLANPELSPERSHNVNGSLHGELGETWLGDVRAEVGVFLRESDELIVLLGDDRTFTHRNVYGSRSFGVEGAFRYSTPGELIVVEANGTWLDLRNRSDEGAFKAYAGDRVPNRPWLFANASWRVQQRSFLTGDDDAAFFWSTQYTHGFFRGWESQGLRSQKQTVPAQLLHAAGLSYGVRAPIELTTTIEIQNLTNAQAYDVFGVERPGRALYLKLIAEL